MLDGSPAGKLVRGQSAEPRSSSQLSVRPVASPATRPRSSQSQTRTVSTQQGRRKPVYPKAPQSLDESLMSLGSEAATRSALRTWTSPSKVLQLDGSLQTDDMVDIMEETHRLKQQLVLLHSAERKMWWSESRRVKKLAQASADEDRHREFTIRTKEWKEAMRLEQMQREETRKTLVELQETQFRDSKEAKRKEKMDGKRREMEELKKAVGNR